MDRARGRPAAGRAGRRRRYSRHSSARTCDPLARSTRPDAQHEALIGREAERGAGRGGVTRSFDDGGADDAGREMGDLEGALAPGPARRTSCRRTRPRPGRRRRMIGRWSSGSSWAAPWKITRRPRRGTPWTAGQNRYGRDRDEVAVGRRRRRRARRGTPVRRARRSGGRPRRAPTAGSASDSHVERRPSGVASRDRATAVDGDAVELGDAGWQLVGPGGRGHRAGGEDLDVPTLQGDTRCSHEQCAASARSRRPRRSRSGGPPARASFLGPDHHPVALSRSGRTRADPSMPTPWKACSHVSGSRGRARGQIGVHGAEREVATTTGLRR